jgi:hypothetical protein
MGGGTLDVAALRINADHLTPEIYVLASQGIDEAGDALDEAIRDLLIEKTLPGSDEFELLKSNPGWVRRAARQLKIQLGDDDITKSTLRLPGGASLELELTSDELRTAFEPQFRRALELMTVVMRIAKTTNWRTTAMTGSEVRGYTREELFPEIQNLLLVGGMSQMPLLRKMLVEAGIPSHKIFGKESIDPDAAVSLGLALDQDYDHLSLDRPGFNFELHWLKNGEPHTEVIYEAYSKLYTPRQALTGQELKLTWANETIGSDASDNGRAVFCARTPAGEIVEISYEGELKEGFGPSFALGTEKRPVIIIQPNGRIFMRDATGAETAVKVEKWPVINVARNRTLSITSSDERGNFTGGLAWHERPWD